MKEITVKSKSKMVIFKKVFGDTWEGQEFKSHDYNPYMEIPSNIVNSTAEVEEYIDNELASDGKVLVIRR